jgi:hypothetical protein
MAARLTLQCAELDPADLQALTDELSNDLNSVSGVEADRAETVGEVGSRGEVITIGNLVLAFISSGAAVAAINVLKSYLSRQPTLSFDIVAEDGQKVSLNAKNLKGEQFDAAIKVLGKSLAKKK